MKTTDRRIGIARNEVRVHGEGTKRLRGASVGLIEMEYSGFAVDGRLDLGLIVYNRAQAPTPTVSDRC